MGYDMFLILVLELKNTLCLSGDALNQDKYKVAITFKLRWFGNVKFVHNCNDTRNLKHTA